MKKLLGRLQIRTEIPAAILLIAAIIPTKAFCQNTTIDFTTLPSGTPITNQYTSQGVSLFTETTGGVKGVPTTNGFDRGVSNSPDGEYPTTEFLDVDFKNPVKLVSFYFNNEGSNGTSNYTVFNAKGLVIGTGSLSPTDEEEGFVTYTLNLPNVTELKLSNGFTDSSWIFGLGSITFQNNISAAFWHGQSHDGLWTSANWATNQAGATTTLTPSAVTDVTFSSNGATHENTTLGADFTIKSLTINDTAPVTISGGNTLTVSGTTGTTGITVNPGAGLFTVNSGLVLSGSSRTFTVSNAAGAVTNGSIGGSVGLIKAGTGSLTLSGSDSYTGNTILENGILVVNNPHALGKGNVSVTGGMLMADPQPIIVNGNYTQTAGALLLQIAGASPGQYDFLKVSGKATLGGSLILLSASGFHLSLGDTLTVIDALSISGHFANVDYSSIIPKGTVNKAIITYNTGNVVVTVEQGSFSPFAGTFNQTQIAKALDNGSSRLNSRLLTFLDSEQTTDLAKDFDALSPSFLSALYEVSFAAANIQQSNIEDRLSDVRNGANGFSSALSINQQSSGRNILYYGKDASKGADKDVLAPSKDNPWGVFVSGNGDFVSVDGDSNARGYDFTTGGVTLGIDYRVNKHFVIGAAFDYAHASTSRTNSGNLDVDSGRGVIYTSVFNGGFYANGYVGGGYNSYDTQRNALLGSATGNGNGAEFDSFIGTGYDFHKGALTFGPIASLEYTNVGIDGFRERGSVAPLDILSQSQSSLRTNLGLKVSHDWRHGKIVITPQVKASWQHEFNYSAIPIDSSFENSAGGAFKVDGPAIARDSALIEAGVRVQWTPTLATYVDYDGKLNASYSSHTVNGGIEISF